jgi:MFS family permease
MREADVPTPRPDRATRARLADDHILRNRSVLGIGLGSLLSDTGHEMATAALPGFLSSIGAQAAALGVIEGIADASLSASKVVGGVIADRPGVERKAVTAGGYAITALGHGLFALAESWPFVAAARAVSWVARGGKAPARDSLLAGSVPPEQLGRAFGVERSMDSLGAIAGPLLAAPLIIAVGYPWLFAISALPGLLAALAVLVLVRETPRILQAAPHINLSIRGLASEPGPYRRLLVGVGLYGLGNFSATLLILRATDLLHHGGRSEVNAAAIAVLLYTAHNAANSLFAYPAGAVADRFGRRHVLVFGIGLFAVASLGFVGGSRDIAVLALLFVLVGASTALVETAQGAYAAELLHESIRGRGFGLLGLVDGIGDLVSSVVVGILFTVTDPAWGFVYAAALSTLGVLVLARRGSHRASTDASS